MLNLPDHKTKIVCTIGPASATQEVMERMLTAGMNVARLNFSHGAFDSHRRVIANLRAAAHARVGLHAWLGAQPGLHRAAPGLPAWLCHHVDGAIL